MLSFWWAASFARSSEFNLRRRVYVGVSEQVLLLGSLAPFVRAEQQEGAAPRRVRAPALFAAVAKFIHTAAVAAAIYYAAFTARGLIIKRERFRPAVWRRRCARRFQWGNITRAPSDDPRTRWRHLSFLLFSPRRRGDSSLIFSCQQI